MRQDQHLPLEVERQIRRIRTLINGTVPYVPRYNAPQALAAALNAALWLAVLVDLADGVAVERDHEVLAEVSVGELPHQKAPSLASARPSHSILT